MFSWEKEGIRFMQDASEYGSYYRRLAELLRPYLTKQSRICDAGCGLGFLSLELAPFVREVVAVDADRRALEVLEENCRKKKEKKIRILQGDMMQLNEGEIFDSMIFCFFGSMDEILSIAERHCRGTVFVFKKNYDRHRFSVGNHAFLHDGFEMAKARLNELSIPFEKQTLELEFGQPFRKVEAARRFYEIYSQDAEKAVITDEFLRKKLVRTEQEEFPYYLPHQRRVGFLKLDAGEIRRSAVRKAGSLERID